MLSRLLKEHQAKQNERKELQGECAGQRPSFCRKPGPRVTSQIRGRAPASGPPERAQAGRDTRQLFWEVRSLANLLESPRHCSGSLGNSPDRAL